MSQHKRVSKGTGGASPPAADNDTMRARREPRISLEVDGPHLRQPGGTPAAVRLHDLSVHGFRTEWHYHLRRGDRVWLKLDGIEALPALVAWEKGFTIGCTFETPLHPAVLAKIVAAFKKT